ncbi:hypothetical protein MHC_03695 [Mycoplasma haemocanis str. Illinois]|uniref:Uncharacterized protein n=1 Tax=Mycoplasma haemocanis (strain Illinois) TaxID=1111676 RepID=H6N7H7_MYCHN|nr:hypothetical protein [Mycoplasma haemocanis]AEW45599.1 hypothetical protein MHC_03695 [Mycoplasma haemocanis str. Illinois]
MSKFLIPTIAGLGVAGVGGGIYLAHKNFENPVSEKKTVRTKLQKAKFKIPSKEDNQHWTSIKTAYNNVRTHADKVFSTSSSEVGEEDLKRLCEEALEKDENDTSYDKAKRWCVVTTTISSYLKEWGMNALPTSDSNNEKQSEWTKLSGEYASSNSKIAGVDSLSSEAWKNLRSECKKLGDKKNYDDDFDTSFESSKIWCIDK